MKASRDKDRSQHADGELKERRIYRERESVPKESEREIEGKKEIGVVTKKNDRARDIQPWRCVRSRDRVSPAPSFLPSGTRQDAEINQWTRDSV